MNQSDAIHARTYDLIVSDSQITVFILILVLTIIKTSFLLDEVG